MDENTFNKYLSSLEENISILPDKPEETPLNTLKALCCMAAGAPVSVIESEKYSISQLDNPDIEQLEKLIAKRIDGTPLAYLTGRQSFMGLEMLAGPEALIPRKETEILGYTALATIDNYDADELTVVDVCTGAGNIALAIANHKDNIKVYAADLSDDAIKLARKNAAHLNLSNQVEFYVGDLLEPLDTLGIDNLADILTCNPPYISSSKVSEMPNEISSFEPELAFDGGSFGINLIRRLIVDAYKFLKPDGHLIFEVGLGQGDIIKKQVEKTGLYKNIKTVNDEAGNPRVVAAQKLEGANDE